MDIQEEIFECLQGFLWFLLSYFFLLLVFSRRFMKWNATIIVAFLFFQSTRTDQNSSTKVLQNIIAPNCTIWSSELNQKGFSCFPRNIPYPARPKGPPSYFFSALQDFFPEKIFPKGPPSIFLLFCDRMDVGKSQRVPPFSFFSARDFFPKIKIFLPFNFLMFCDKTTSTATKMLTISEVSSFQRARGSR